ncbi:DUF192 domain-containing protein [Candidatus Zixiibacteriota bacterium]
MVLFNSRKFILLPLLLLLPLVVRCGGGAQREPSPGTDRAPADSARVDDRISIRVAGILVRVRVSQRPEELEQGLKLIENLAPDEGMLFVFEKQKILHFWMQDTPLPLSVAFIDKSGRIVDIQQMEPLNDKTIHTSRQKALYALEMNAGWFQKHGVKVGDVVEF